MQVQFEIDCSPNEVRRLAGGVDLSPLVEVSQAVAERTLIETSGLLGERGSACAPAAGVGERAQGSPEGAPIHPGFSRKK